MSALKTSEGGKSRMYVWSRACSRRPGLSLGGSSRALSLCGWPARCLLGVGVDALPALPPPELHGSLAAPAEQQEKLELPSSRSLLPRLENLTEAMTTGGRSAAGFGRSAAGVRVRTQELHCYLIHIIADSQIATWS